MRSSSRRPPNAIWVAGALLFILIWVLALILTMSTLEKRTGTSFDATILEHSKNNDGDVAKEIPGIELKIAHHTPTDDPIQIVYTNDTSPTATHKGLVLLLHACSHSAIKFFSPSSSCPTCVGLSEELRIVRLVVEMGYTPVAVSSVNQVNRCWSMPRDVPRIEAVLKHELFQKYQHGHVFAIGASSGGALAAELAIREIVQGALVEVMQLSSDMVKRIRVSPKPIYLAPMPRDKNRMKQVMKNYHDLETVKDRIVLDNTTCGSLPLTTKYLLQRVPRMTTTAAEELISLLKQAGHIDSSGMLQIDPTRSDWRNIISPNNATHWLNTFDLKPGYSPTAKALHRAWAFHEYCSEAVIPFLSFAERLSKKLN